jgi:hypothetical protein
MAEHIEADDRSSLTAQSAPVSEEAQDSEAANLPVEDAEADDRSSLTAQSAPVSEEAQDSEAANLPVEDAEADDRSSLTAQSAPVSEEAQDSEAANLPVEDAEADDRSSLAEQQGPVVEQEQMRPAAQDAEDERTLKVIKEDEPIVELTEAAENSEHVHADLTSPYGPQSIDDLERQISSTATELPEAPALGTAEFSSYAQRSYTGRFADTPAVGRLWKRASHDQPNSREGFNRSRDRFWNLVHDDSEASQDTTSNSVQEIRNDARVVSAILELAGFDLSGEGAPKLRLESDPKIDTASVKYAAIHDRIHKEANIPTRKGRPLSNAERARREVVYRSLDIDHRIPASYAKGMSDETKSRLKLWLKAQNLQFMFGDDNRFHKRDTYHR